MKITYPVKVTEHLGNSHDHENFECRDAAGKVLFDNGSAGGEYKGKTRKELISVATQLNSGYRARKRLRTVDPSSQLKRFSKDERSLLLYVEARAVDFGGRMNPAQLNGIDMEILKRWQSEGKLEFGRIASEDVNRDGSLWVRLEPETIFLAQAERRARIIRMQKNRHYKTTEEKRNAD